MLVVLILRFIFFWLKIVSHDFNKISSIFLYSESHDIVKFFVKTDSFLYRAPTVISSSHHDSFT